MFADGGAPPLKGGKGHYLSDREHGKRFEREGTGWKQVDDTNDPTWKAMDGVRKAFSESGFKTRLRGAINDAAKKGLISRTGGKGPDYWGSTIEVFARSFERYVQRKLEKSNRMNTYLAGVKKHEFWPTDDEVDKMAPAFDALLEAAKTSDRLKKG